MPLPFTNYEASRHWLYNLKNRGSKYGIERMLVFVKRLGHPEKAFPIIHVAGTNGKGSVCVMLERIYRATGLKTGLFTSPHLIHQGERIQVNREILGETQILKFTNELLPIAIEMSESHPDNHPSFFEWMTAMAFVYFKTQKVDLAIIETGLGGRLDSTNVVNPEISVITSVGLDHTEILGEKIDEIAKEKAGIIKPNKPVILGKMPQEARQVIMAVAAQRNAPVYCVEQYFTEKTLPQTNLQGTVQRWNAATSMLVTDILHKKFPVPQKTKPKALIDISWQGRWSTEKAGTRTVIFDAAHNADAVDALVENLSGLTNKPIIVAGFTGTVRKAAAILPALQAHSEKLILVQPSHPRGIKTEVISQGIPSSAIERLFPGKGMCDIKPADATVVVTGSIYLVAEIYERLLYDEPKGQQILQD
jgi:dihydrofolate synthase/folylpolyglutamate synthase